MNEKGLELGFKKLTDSPIKEKKNNIIEEQINVMGTNCKTNNDICKTLIAENEINKDQIIIKNRCSFENCKRKLTLVEQDIKCKCGNVFCAKHRYTNDHNCTFDYKKDYKGKLEKQMDKVISEKISKI